VFKPPGGKQNTLEKYAIMLDFTLFEDKCPKPPMGNATPL